MASEWMERVVPVEKAGRDFDIEFWQRQGDAAIFAAAWDLVVTAMATRGIPREQLRLRRDIEKLRRLDEPERDD